MIYMNRTLITMIFILIVLSACNTENTDSLSKAETNYYISLSGEGEHWKLDGYEILMTPEGYKAGQGILKMKEQDEQREGFLSYDVYTLVGGEEERFHGGSVAGDADITEMNTGTIHVQEENLKEFPEIDEIYMSVTWNHAETDGDQNEKIILYNKVKNGETLLD